MPPIETATLLAAVLNDPARSWAGLPTPRLPVSGVPLGDLATLAAPAGERGPAWAAAAFFALLTLALTVWLHRRIKPELLTPANAHLAYTDEATQPGGAPSA
ncbi:hypothetical protein [Catellatospora sp. NPDC049609]|uniref:hypothetical protein n=1 Tax=Catellatospora sp. NPDC049609 TaxID=3155505 RepID=UPI00343A5ECB